MLRPPLMEHQREGIDWIQWTARGLLADEPGLGKTRQAIEAFDGGRNLVIAPKMVIEGGTWEDELNRWSMDPSRWTVAPYSMLNVRRNGKPVKVLRPEFKGKWDNVVFDECHYVKGRDALWTWAGKELTRKSAGMLAMTGTPFPNWAHEIFTILQYIYVSEGYRGRGTRFSSFWEWAETWFDCSPSKFSRGFPVAGEMLGCSTSKRQLAECHARPINDPCQHYLDFADANLGGAYLRRWRDDVLDLPPITDTDVLVPMTATTKKTYLGLRDSFYATHDGSEVVAWNSGEQHVKMHKLTTSPWLLEQNGEPRGGKLERLRFDLGSRARPTLVFAHYRDTVEACARVAASTTSSVGVVHGGIPESSRIESFKRFKSGDLDVLVGSLETLSEGHTLVAADMAIFVEESFKPYRNEQAKNRVHRMGQTRPVTILRYLCPNSLDSKRRRLLQRKTDQQMRALTAAEMMEIM